MACKQLQDIRKKRIEGTQRPTLDKPLKGPVFAVSALITAVSLAMVFLR